LPLLSTCECGGFTVFASPTIFIPNYEDNSHDYYEPIASARDNNTFTPSDSSNFANRYRERSLTMIYGQNVYLNQKNANKAGKIEKSPSLSFLQENIEEINDEMLKMMPMLKNITK
jgi:hypothetical protein